LGADEQNQAATSGDLGQVLLGPQETANRFADVDDVDQLVATVDVRPHFRVPAAGTMAKVGTRLNELFDEFSGQQYLLEQLKAHRLLRPSRAKPVGQAAADMSGVDRNTIGQGS